MQPTNNISYDQKLGIPSLLQSSSDPAQISNTVRGAILSVSALLLLGAQYVGLPIDQDGITEIATQAGLTFGGIWFFYGLITKAVMFAGRKASSMPTSVTEKQEMLGGSPYAPVPSPLIAPISMNKPISPMPMPVSMPMPPASISPRVVMPSQPLMPHSATAPQWPLGVGSNPSSSVPFSSNDAAAATPLGNRWQG